MAKQKATETFTAADALAALRRRYHDPARYFVLTEVGNYTGLNCTSWIDAVVVSLWPSDGLFRRAFEVKVSRADFVREIAQPKKNEWARARMNEFYYIAPGNVIKTLDEVPEGCGWLKLTRGGLTMIKVAAINKAAPVDATLLATALRAARRSCNELIDAGVREKLATDPEAITNRAMIEATKAFLKERGISGAIYDADTMRAALAKACAEAEIQREAEAIRRRIGSLHSEMESLFWRFAELAFATWNDKDERGDSMLAHYRHTDRQLLHDRALNSKGHDKKQAADTLRDCGLMDAMIEAANERA